MIHRWFDYFIPAKLFYDSFTFRGIWYLFTFFLTQSRFRFLLFRPMCSVTIFGQLAWHWQIQCGELEILQCISSLAINYFNGQQNVNLRKLDSVTGLIRNSDTIFSLFNFQIIKDICNIENEMNIPSRDF